MYVHIFVSQYFHSNKKTNSMKKLLLLSAIALMSLATNAQTNWAVDGMHSSVKFSVSHMMISEVEGIFKKFDGAIVSAKPDFTDAKVNFTVDVNSINTDNEMRDKHLKSDDFFNAEKYPNMTFVSTSFKKVNAKSYVLEGNMTIRDVTKKIKYTVTYGGTGKDPYGNVKAGFKATTKISRKAYGLKWNTLTEAGGAMVGDEITITLNLEFAQKK